MLERGKVFYEKLVAARGKVAKVAAHFITDGSVRTDIYKKYLRYFHFFYSYYCVIFRLYYCVILDYTHAFQIKSSAASNEGSCCE